MRSLFHIVSALALLAAHVASGQDNTSHYPDNLLKINTLRLIDLASPCIEIGYERKLNRNVSMFLAGGPLGCFKPEEFQHYSGARIVGELKYLDPNHAIADEFGIKILLPSLCFAYNNINIGTVRPFEHYDSTVRPIIYYHYDDSISVFKQTLAVTANLTNTIIKKRFVFEYVVGMG